MLTRYLVLDSQNSHKGRCIVYAHNSCQAANLAKDTLKYQLGHFPKSVIVCSTNEDGSFRAILNRYD